MSRRGVRRGAHVFEVRPRKVLSFAKGDFAQTRFRFDG
jgi:hypothetical protein